MAIAVPVVATALSVASFGKPVVDQLNTNTTDIANLKTATAVTAWATPTLLNSWASYGGGYAPAGYRKVGDLLYVRGLIKSGTAGQVIFNLPVGFRPPYNQQFATEANNSYAAFQIMSSGDVVHMVGANSAFNIQCVTSLTA